ncbi:MAG: oligosaccharide flippase family protein, partial [Anaerolineaceae bacterium]|nr:oligosaccharide flippase family protein [Anaerolineaceae bacterium]
MKRIRSIWNGWQQDRTLRSVVRNTGYLFTSNTITMVLSPIQGFLAAFLLGPAGYGTLMMVVLLASTVNRLLSFRMNELVIKNAGQDLAVGNRQRAAAIIKVAGITEAGTSVLAYLLLVLIAPLASQYIIKDPTASRYVVLYGIALLANFVTESGTAVLQIGNHFRSQAALNVVQYVISTTMMVIAYITGGSFLFVLSAYLVGRLVYGLGIMIFAVRWLKPM